MQMSRTRAVLLGALLFVAGVWAGSVLPRGSAARASGANRAPNGANADSAIARLFAAVRGQGIGAAMDSLRAMGTNDPAIRSLSPTMLHHVAHSLGRAAEKESGHDPRVMLECRVGYAAGCYHGVMEEYFASNPPSDSASLAKLCAEIAPRSPALAERECAHGMGHGLLELPGYTIARALDSCDYLPGAELQRECYDGVFMSTVSSPGSHEGHDMQHDMQGMEGMSMPGGHGAQPTGAGSVDGCANLQGRRLGSCWAYRPLLLIGENAGDLEPVIDTCDTVPALARGDCYYGVGKQGAALYSDDPALVGRACRSGDPMLARNCRAGAVAYYTDVDWKADLAANFCSTLRDSEKPDCYTSLGADVRLMQPDSESLERQCSEVESAYRSLCTGSVTERELASARAHAHAR